MTEIERLQDAKRRALAIADERAKENVRLRAERDVLVKALEFIRDGYANQDVSHIAFRVQAYRAALDAVADVSGAKDISNE
jgi:L-fucose isomerase-like protein